MGKKKIIILALFKSKPEFKDKAYQELKLLVEHTKKEPGCIKYELHLSLNEPTQFMLYEEWENQNALDLHKESSHLAHFRTTRMEYLSEQPNVSLWCKDQWSNDQ